jgi:ubiquinone/menaquinone biosynthesis C-methylase UbiE
MNADPIARYYQSLEYLCFGRTLEKRRFAFLTETRASRYAVLCGDGDGRFLERLVRINEGVRVDFVESSVKMIERAKTRIAGATRDVRTRVRFYAADIRDFQPSERTYDLIASHFFLDCFTDSEAAVVVARLAGWAAPGARWIISEFRETEGAVGRIWSRSVIRSLYFAFRITTDLRVSQLPNYAALLSNAGFSLRAEQNALAGLLTSTLWQRD